MANKSSFYEQSPRKIEYFPFFAKVCLPFCVSLTQFKTGSSLDVSGNFWSSAQLENRRENDRKNGRANCCLQANLWRKKPAYFTNFLHMKRKRARNVLFYSFNFLCPKILFNS